MIAALVACDKFAQLFITLLRAQMFFKFIGITVCVVVGGIFILALLGNFISESQRNEPPTVIHVPADMRDNPEIENIYLNGQV
jgi:hypothetical protein